MQATILGEDQYRPILLGVAAADNRFVLPFGGYGVGLEIKAMIISGDEGRNLVDISVEDVAVLKDWID